MNFRSKKAAFLILGITAIVCSKVLFFSFNDPQGPNLLIVGMMAVILYALSLAIYVFKTPTKLDDLKRLLAGILIQVLAVTGLYFLLS